MKRILTLTSLALSLSCAAAFAQQTADPQTGTPAPYHQHHKMHDPQRQAEMLGKRLNLTPDQTAKVEPILADREQKMQTLMGNQQLTPEDRHQQMRALHQSTEQQLAGVLTPDQMTQLKSMHHHRRHGQSEENNGQTPSA